MGFLTSAVSKLPLREWDAAAVAGVASAAAAMQVPLAAIIDWIRVDVFATYWQIVSLFFAKIASNAIESARTFFGEISTFLSVDWSWTIPSIPPAVVFGIIAVAGITVMICMICALCAGQSRTASTNEILRGPEAQTWDKQAATSKRSLQWIRYSLLAATLLYLPISRIALQVFACDVTMGTLIARLDSSAPCNVTSMPGEDPANPSFYRRQVGPIYTCNCRAWNHYGAFLAAAIIIFVILTICFPMCAMQLITKNAPRGSTEDPDYRFDEDGTRVPYSLEMYRKDLATDPRYKNSPFLPLFDGYERKGRYYKVLVMILKFALVVPTVVLWDRVGPQVGVSLAILFMFGAFSLSQRPYIDPTADFMEACGRVAAFLTALFGLIGSSSCVAMARVGEWLLLPLCCHATDPPPPPPNAGWHPSRQPRWACSSTWPTPSTLPSWACACCWASAPCAAWCAGCASRRCSSRIRWRTGWAA